MAKRKKVNIDRNPITTKKPRIEKGLPNPLDAKPSWQVSNIDLNGKWGWGKIDSKYFFSQIIKKVSNFESMYWRDILKGNNHEVKVYQISREAQKRLEELELNDIESLVSLRLKGLERIWGIRIRSILKILWWDPLHEVFPSTKKHT